MITSGTSTKQRKDVLGHLNSTFKQYASEPEAQMMKILEKMARTFSYRILSEFSLQVESGNKDISPPSTAARGATRSTTRASSSTPAQPLTTAPPSTPVKSKNLAASTLAPRASQRHFFRFSLPARGYFVPNQYYRLRNGLFCGLGNLEGCMPDNLAAFETIEK